jgi:hypothetical protein
MRILPSGLLLPFDVRAAASSDHMRCVSLQFHVAQRFIVGRVDGMYLRFHAAEGRSMLRASASEINAARHAQI